MRIILLFGLALILSALIWAGFEIKDIFTPTYPCKECLRKDKIIYKLTIDSTHKDCIPFKLNNK